MQASLHESGGTSGVNELKSTAAICTYQAMSNIPLGNQMTIVRSENNGHAAGSYEVALGKVSRNARDLRDPIPRRASAGTLKSGGFVSERAQKPTPGAHGGVKKPEVRVTGSISSVGNGDGSGINTSLGARVTVPLTDKSSSGPSCSASASIVRQQNKGEFNSKPIENTVIGGSGQIKCQSPSGENASLGMFGEVVTNQDGQQTPTIGGSVGVGLKKNLLGNTSFHVGLNVAVLSIGGDPQLRPNMKTDVEFPIGRDATLGTYVSGQLRIPMGGSTQPNQSIVTVGSDLKLNMNDKWSARVGVGYNLPSNGPAVSGNFDNFPVPNSAFIKGDVEMKF
jgi:hypothetical protein